MRIFFENNTATVVVLFHSAK